VCKWLGVGGHKGKGKRESEKAKIKRGKVTKKGKVKGRIRKGK
jgi:hypothetical protein